MSPFSSLLLRYKVRLLGTRRGAYNRGPSRGRSPICPGAGTFPRPPSPISLCQVLSECRRPASLAVAQLKS